MSVEKYGLPRMPDKGTKTCSICMEEFDGFGHNPEPILSYEKRCCDDCNQTVVVPVRIFGLQAPIAIAALKKHGFEVKGKIERRRGK